jgi:hypothetical protein
MVHDINEERWTDLIEFPGYSVSDHGRVLSDKTNSCITPTRNTNGSVMVGLMRAGIQNKRSLPLLVARTYLPLPKNEAFDTPIHLDGDRSNCHYRNLMWRPLWFSRKYMKQFIDDHNTFEHELEDVETGELYKNSMAAATINGLLDTEIRTAMLENSYVWPTGQVFRAAFNR